MKDNKIMKLTLVALLLAMIALILVSSTYAKYTTTVSGSDTAVVAKWSILVNNQEMAVTGSAPTVQVGLFDTIKDTKDGSVETDVKTGLIAPGTQGEFNFKIDNKSEVKANYSINFTVSDSSLPLQFKVNDSEWTDSLTNIPATELVAETGTNTVNVQWRWPFEGDDTAIGIAARDGKDVTVTASIKAEQVD